MSVPLVVMLGASGLLGTAITRELAVRPIRLRLVARRATAVPPDRRAEVDVRTVDLTEPGELARAVAGADAVVYLVMFTTGMGAWRSAENDGLAERVNLGLVRELIDVASTEQVPPVVVFAGSTTQTGRLDGTGPDEPTTVYGKQKLIAERTLEAATSAGTVRAISLRLPTLYSQGTDPASHDRGVVAAMTRRALAGEPLTMWHDGTVQRDLLCVDDAARAFVAALDHVETLAGRHWPLGSGRATSVADLFTMIAAVVARSTGKPPVPVISVEPPPESVADDHIDYLPDPSAFQRATGWSATVSLREGLENLVKLTNSA